MKSSRILGAAAAAWLAGSAAVAARAGELEFESSGGTYLQYYLTQDNRYNPLPPGYRFAFSIENLVYRTDRGHWFLNAANSTLISRSDSTAVKLDMIRYKIEPGFRLELSRHEADFLLSHECIHQIDKANATGSVFWNALEADFGSAGAFDHNLIRRVVERDFQMRNSFDYRLRADAFLFGDWLYWVDQNHDYRGHLPRFQAAGLGDGRRGMAGAKHRAGELDPAEPEKRRRALRRIHPLGPEPLRERELALKPGVAHPLLGRLPRELARPRAFARSAKTPGRRS
jgi:hypothetical protein